MTLPEKILAGFVLLTGLCSALLAFAAHHYRDPLAFLGDRDRAHMLDAAEAHTAAYEYAERESLELDYLFSLPSREPSA